MDLVVKKINGDEFVYNNTSMIGIKPDDNMLVLVADDVKINAQLDEIDEYYFVDSKPKELYVVVNKAKIDRDGLPTFVTFGYDLQQLLSAYHGKAYQIMKVKTLSDREEW